MTGHTHINYANRITERMTEHNIAAVCATWWWTGNYTNGRTQMCRDGAPAGYGLFEIGTAGADDVQWHYQGIGKAADYQFRAYDLNRCLITRDKYCPDIKNNFGTVSAEFFAQYANGYDRPRSDNTVLIVAHVRGGLLLAHDHARNHRDRRIRPQLYRNDVAPARTLRYVRLPAVVTAAVRTEAERGGRLRSDRRPCAAAEGVRIPIHLFI